MVDGTVIGIDVGSVAASVVIMGSDGNILAGEYCFHRGDVEKCVRRMIEKLNVGEQVIAAATSSTPGFVNTRHRYDNQVAVIESARQYHQGVRAVLAVGGEKFFYSTFDESGNYTGSSCNTSCAAGTGSFLDQQASRLKMQDIEELSATACRNNGRCPEIASRCAVFAKTDLIHAQQEGYQYEEISDGLCAGLAKNIVDTLFAAGKLPPEILFCGGVSKNLAVARHIEALTSAKLIRAQYGHMYGAAGAALCLIADMEKSTVEPMSAAALVLARLQDKKYYYPPLQLTKSSYPDFSSLSRYAHNSGGNNPVEVDIYQEPKQVEHVCLGLDIGSTSTKAVLVNEKQEVIAGFYTRTAGRPLQATMDIFASMAEMERIKAVRFEVVQCATTGSGRKFIGKIIGSDIVLDEITAHARAATQLNAQVDTIIEIGGQDAKFTVLRHGRVTSSTMNNVCAAGTGSFIEEQAARLGCPIEEYGSRAAGVSAPMASDRCTVFMERDINHYLSDGFSVNEVLAAALHSVCENYLMKVATEKNIGSTIFFQGATAKNRSLVAAFENRLQKPILVSKYCHLTGALGAALVALEERCSPTTFAGFSLSQTTPQVTAEVCGFCNNACKISVADTPSGKVAYGFLCGREYEDSTYVPRNNGAIDLLSLRKKIMPRPIPKPSRSELVIGLPAAVHMVDDLAFWEIFFAELGVKTVSTSVRQNHIAVGKKLSLSEFCAPVTAMHGHVNALLDQADYVFLPFYLEMKSKEARRQFCYYTQFLPGIMGFVGPDRAERILSPVIRYLYTPFHAKRQLYRMVKDIMPDPPGFLEVSRAFDHAVQLDQQYRNSLKTIFADESGKTDDIEVLLVGRPYTVLAPAMNCGIPEIFAALGINVFFQDMITCNDEDVEHIAPLLREIHWQHAATILKAAEVSATTEGIYPVYITSFKCSPDSFTLEYFKSIMEANNKPYLVLELDEHGSNVGYETRIEAAVRSFRNHRQEEKSTITAPLMLPDYRTINPHFAGSVKDKNIVLPNWDRITCALLAATLEREGYDAYVIHETEETIRKSLKYNSGQCIPLNAIAQGFVETIERHQLAPEKTALWLNKSTLACNIKLYPYHIKTLLTNRGLGDAGVYIGSLTLTDISLRAAMNAYFSYMFGGLLRRTACSIRPYEIEKGATDRVLEDSIAILADAFRGERSKEDALHEVIGLFEAVPVQRHQRPLVALFGDLYSRDNRVMNQDLIRFIEGHGGEVITTPYSEYAKMIASAYFRKWFNEGKYIDVLSNSAILATMVQMEKKYSLIFNRILRDSLHRYDDSPAEILASYDISVENTGESMDNILKIHYIKKHYPDVALFVQASPALCCASLVTEAMRTKITEKTGVPVVSVIYDGTAGEKNAGIVPYLKYGRRKNEKDERLVCHR
jgi:predicted CoA-substrate-specific enzyme activase